MLFYVYPTAPGSIHSTTYYDDQGKTTAIERGEFYSTKVDYEYIDPTHIRIVINPVEGKGYAESVEERNYEFRLFNVFPASSVSINGEEFKYNVVCSLSCPFIHSMVVPMNSVSTASGSVTSTVMTARPSPSGSTPRPSTTSMTYRVLFSVISVEGRSPYYSSG